MFPLMETSVPALQINVPPLKNKCPSLPNKLSFGFLDSPLRICLLAAELLLLLICGWAIATQ